MDHGKSTCLHLLSFYDPEINEWMNRDQPLIHFYHKVFLPVNDGGETDRPSPYVNEARLTREGQIAEVNGVKIRFHRYVASGRFP
jgi:hypothetical protein